MKVSGNIDFLLIFVKQVDHSSLAFLLEIDFLNYKLNC